MTSTRAGSLTGSFTLLGHIPWVWIAVGLVLESASMAAFAVMLRRLLLVYGSGVAAQSLNIVPGGLGITEGALGLTLVASGLHASQALAAVLLYRLASFWLVASAGWAVFLWLRHRRQPKAPRRARLQHA